MKYSCFLLSKVFNSLIVLSISVKYFPLLLKFFNFFSSNRDWDFKIFIWFNNSLFSDFILSVFFSIVSLFKFLSLLFKRSYCCLNILFWFFVILKSLIFCSSWYFNSYKFSSLLPNSSNSALSFCKKSEFSTKYILSFSNKEFNWSL